MRKIVPFILLCSFSYGCQDQPTVDNVAQAQVVDTPIIEKGATVIEEEPVELILPNEVQPLLNLEFTDDYLMGKFNPNKHPDFSPVKSIHASRSGMYLRTDTYEAFVKMYDAALANGIKLRVISATRPFHAQKSIWEAKWSGARKVEGKNLSQSIPDAGTRALKILEYSSMPGTSRHHWGTDLDLNNLENSWFAKGEGLKIYTWLSENAATYGFCQPYSPKGDTRPFGYEEEKWHWSYTPVSKPLLKAYSERITEANIKGFKGAESAATIGVIEKYVEGIKHVCK